jgi:metal-sulfur cluster biosynthetic enzyme
MICVDRTEEVWSALSVVTDPEIDESVVSLDFVTDVKVASDSRVEIDFRLPTYWCAPNFAFLMASDMRDAVAALEWVTEVSVKLSDHFSADLINRSVALRQDFRDAFPGETDGDLSSIRRKFLGYAFERRQELLLRYLVAKGQTPDWFRRALLSELMALPLDPEGISLRNLYLFTMRRMIPGGLQESLAFVTVNGESLEAQDFKAYLRQITGVRRTAEFNGFLCRSLLTERVKRMGETGDKGEGRSTKDDLSANGER